MFDKQLGLRHYAR